MFGISSCALPATYTYIMDPSHTGSGLGTTEGKRGPLCMGLLLGLQ